MDQQERFRPELLVEGSKPLGKDVREPSKIRIDVFTGVKDQEYPQYGLGAAGACPSTAARARRRRTAACTTQPLTQQQHVGKALTTAIPSSGSSHSARPIAAFWLVVVAVSIAAAVKAYDFGPPRPGWNVVTVQTPAAASATDSSRGHAAALVGAGVRHGWQHQELFSRGIGFKAFARVYGASAALAVAMLALQEGVLRPLLRGSSKEKSNQLLFACGVATEALLLAVTVSYVYIGNLPAAWWSVAANAQLPPPAARGDGYLLWGFSLVTASYTTELTSLALRPADFAPRLRHMMAQHHYLALAWVAVWLLVLAPDPAAGAPIYITAMLYLCGGLPTDAFKLASLRCSNMRLLAVAAIPAAWAHWGILIWSQLLYYGECPCSALACWSHPGQLSMLITGWVFAMIDVVSYINCFVARGSRLMGFPLRVEEIPPILLVGRRTWWRPQQPLATPTLS